ncbi:MAG: hypothetical protein E7561_02650 [Ruminococcaceae bacterium]|nr:hypothetical protein [Oscillospiraceae bacterium]
MFSVLSTNASAQTGTVSPYEKLYMGMLNMESVIDLSEYMIPEAEIGSYITSVLHTYPELFHISNEYYYWLDESESTYISQVAFNYIMTKEEYKNRLNEFDLWVEEIASGVDSSATDLEKLFYVHEYFVSHLEYDYSETIFDAYNMLKYKTGVCQAYTLAFTAVVRKMGIYSTSALNDAERHCWNIVKLGDNYYHIDVTHDDPRVVYEDSQNNDFNAGNYGRRSLFLLSDDTVKKFSYHSSWVSVGGQYVCSDTTYENKFWESYKHPNIYCDGGWYQVCEQGKFTSENGNMYWSADIKRVMENGEMQVLKTINTPAKKTNNQYVSVNHNGYAVGNLIYGNSNNNFWWYNPKTEEFKVFFVAPYDVIESYYYCGKIFYLLSNNEGIYAWRYYQLAMGDIDGDGMILANDLVGIKKFLLLREADFNYGLLDFNADGYINILDYIDMNKAVSNATV